MICPNCGTENKDSAKFCKKCGSTLKDVSKDNEIPTHETNNNHSKNLIIICVTILICSSLIAGGIILYTNEHSENTTPNTVSNNSVDSNIDSNKNNNESESKPSTINSDVYSYSVQGVDFNVPSPGHMRTSEALSFEYNGETCEVQKVPQYEASTYNHELSSVTFTKNYQDGEPYRLIVNNHPWIGVKVKKGGKWFHISMNINDATEAEKLVDWMSQHNTWNSP